MPADRRWGRHLIRLLRNDPYPAAMLAAGGGYAARGAARGAARARGFLFPRRRTRGRGYHKYRYRKQKKLFKRRRGRFRRKGSKLPGLRKKSSLYRLNRQANGHLLQHHPRQGWTNITETTFDYSVGSTTSPNFWERLFSVSDITDVFAGNWEQTTLAHSTAAATDTRSPEWAVWASLYDSCMIQKVHLAFEFQWSGSPHTAVTPVNYPETYNRCLIIEYGEQLQSIFPNDSLTNGLTSTDAEDWRVVKRRIAANPGRIMIKMLPKPMRTGTGSFNNPVQKVNITIPVYKAFNLRQKLYDVSDEVGDQRFKVDISDTVTAGKPTVTAYTTHPSTINRLPFVVTLVSMNHNAEPTNQEVPHCSMKCIRTQYVRFYDRVKDYTDQDPSTVAA